MRSPRCPSPWHNPQMTIDDELKHRGQRATARTVALLFFLETHILSRGMKQVERGMKASNPSMMASAIH